MYWKLSTNADDSSREVPLHVESSGHLMPQGAVTDILRVSSIRPLNRLSNFLCYGLHRHAPSF